MKKSIVIFSCAFSLFFFGCASKTTPVETENDITAPEINTTQEDTSASESEIESTDSQEDELSSEQTDLEENNTDETETLEEQEVTDNSDELEEIIEPVVITLEYPEEPEEETVSEAEEEQTPEEMIEPEEVELPAEEPEVTESKDTSVDPTDNITETQTSENDDSISNEEEDDDDVIDVTDDDASAIEDDSELVVEEIVPSRKVTLKKFEYLDIVYPGNGWVYMGLTDGSKDLTYFGRKLGTGQTKFTLQAKNSGIKIIHFYKEDNLTSDTLDDYIEVEILNEKGSNKDHVSAPEYKLPLTKKAKEVIEVNKKKIEAKEELEKTETIEAAETQSKTEETTKQADIKVEKEVSVPKETKITETKETIAETPVQQKVTKTQDSKLLLQEAQLLYNEKEYEAANKKIEEFFEVAVTKRDEGLFLKGQILEAKSNIQNIKEAIETYTTLTKNYPASKYWDDANKRIIYLKRFYLEVR